MTPFLPIRVAATLAAGAVVSAAPAAAQGASQPDVFLASLVMQDGRVQVGAPRNVSAWRGYDNQPAFAPDGRTLFYTSTRDDAQADIYRVELASGRVTRVTHSAPESEYSATVTPDGTALSVIRVERDSAQRLWRVPLDGSEPSVILADVRPVGYHVWAGTSQLALFVLGSPNTLQLADTRTGRADTLLVNIGRSLHRIPGGSRVSFVSKAYAETAWVMELDPATRAVRPLARLPRGVEDHAWLPDGRLIAGDGSRLLVCDPAATAEWVQVADLATAGLGAITRLAVAPGGDRIAIVAAPVAR